MSVLNTALILCQLLSCREQSYLEAVYEVLAHTFDSDLVDIRASAKHTQSLKCVHGILNAGVIIDGKEEINEAFSLHLAK